VDGRPERLLEQRPHQRNARRAAHQAHPTDLRSVDLGILDRLARKLDGAVQQRADQLLELSARDRRLEVNRLARHVGEELLAFPGSANRSA
jgi:hypothetical protein